MLAAAHRPADVFVLLRTAWSLWRRLDAPYEAALTRLALGRAARSAGDEEGAQLEFDAARAVLDASGRPRTWCGWSGSPPQRRAHPSQG